MSAGRYGAHLLPRSAGESCLRGLIGWMGAFLVGSAGWWLGAKAGLGIAVVLGAVASGVGLYVGHRWFDQNLK
ncbi:MAG: hypothetical protein V9E93_19075 [Steroidobacteraceae bacterium]